MLYEVITLTDDLEREVRALETIVGHDVAVSIREIGVIELAGREIDADVDLDSVIAPLHLLCGCLAEDEFADFGHQTEGLGLGQELEGPDETSYNFV